MRKNFTKFLGLLLTVMMIVTMVPATAFADDAVALSDSADYLKLADGTELLYNGVTDGDYINFTLAKDLAGDSATYDGVKIANGNYYLTQGFSIASEVSVSDATLAALPEAMVEYVQERDYHLAQCSGGTSVSTYAGIPDVYLFLERHGVYLDPMILDNTIDAVGGKQGSDGVGPFVAATNYDHPYFSLVYTAGGSDAWAGDHAVWVGSAFAEFYVHKDFLKAVKIDTAVIGENVKPLITDNFTAADLADLGYTDEELEAIGFEVTGETPEEPVEPEVPEVDANFVKLANGSELVLHAVDGDVLNFLLAEDLAGRYGAEGWVISGGQYYIASSWATNSGTSVSDAAMARLPEAMVDYVQTKEFGVNMAGGAGSLNMVELKASVPSHDTLAAHADIIMPKINDNEGFTAGGKGAEVGICLAAVNDHHPWFHYAFPDGVVASDGNYFTGSVFAEFYVNRDFFKAAKIDTTAIGANVKAIIVENYVASDLVGLGYTNEELAQIGFVVPEEPEVVKVTGVELDATELALNVGETATLVATVLPEDAEDKSVVWTTSDEDVVTVDEGVVVAVGAGEATITVKTVDGGFEATATVTVTVVEETTSVMAAPGYVRLADADSNFTEFIMGDVITVDGKDYINLIAAHDLYDADNGRTGARFVSITKGVDYEGEALPEDGNWYVSTGIIKNNHSYTSNEINGEYISYLPVEMQEALLKYSYDYGTVALYDNYKKHTIRSMTKLAIISREQAEANAEYLSDAAKFNYLVTSTGTGNTGYGYYRYSYDAGKIVKETTYEFPRGSLFATMYVDADIIKTVKFDVDTMGETLKSYMLENYTAEDMVATGLYTDDELVALGYEIASEPEEPEIVKVTGVELDATELALTVDETATLVATVLPEDATDKSVVWTSSDDAVATVVDGVVTAVGAGEATIIVTTVDGDFKAECVVTVNAKEVKVTGVELDITEMALQFGESVELTATVTPEDATNKNIIWTTSDENVATVRWGRVTATGEGTATITATTEDGEFTATATVTVEDNLLTSPDHVKLSNGVSLLYNGVSEGDYYSFLLTNDLAGKEGNDGFVVQNGQYYITTDFATSSGISVADAAMAKLPEAMQDYVAVRPYGANTVLGAGALTYTDLKAGIPCHATLDRHADYIMGRINDNFIPAVGGYAGANGLGCYFAAVNDHHPWFQYAFPNGAVVSDGTYFVGSVFAEFYVHKNFFKEIKIDTATLGDNVKAILAENFVKSDFADLGYTDEELDSWGLTDVIEIPAGSSFVAGTNSYVLTDMVTTDENGKKYYGIINTSALTHQNGWGFLTFADTDASTDTVKYLNVSAVGQWGTPWFSGGSASYDINGDYIQSTYFPAATFGDYLKEHEWEIDTIIAGDYGAKWAWGNEGEFDLRYIGKVGVPTADELIAARTIDNNKFTDTTAAVTTLVQWPAFYINAGTLTVTSEPATGAWDSGVVNYGASNNMTDRTAGAFGNVFFKAFLSEDYFLNTKLDVATTSENVIAMLAANYVRSDFAEGLYTDEEFEVFGIPAAPATVKVTGVELDAAELTLNVDETATLVATVLPEDAEDKSVIWTSSDDAVATVVDGVVTAVGAGEATITVTTVDGGFEATCKVTVLAPVVVAPSITVESKETVAGKTERISVSLDNNPGLVSALIRVTFDSEYLTLVGVEDAGILGNANHSDNYEKVPYILSWENDTADIVAVSGKIVDLVFKVSGFAPAGSYDIEIAYGELLDEELEFVEFDVVNGKIEVLDYLMGDVDGDGVVNTKDRVVLSRHLAGWLGYETIVSIAADVNSDSEVDAKDRMFIARHLAGWIGYENWPIVK